MIKKLFYMMLGVVLFIAILGAIFIYKSSQYSNVDPVEKDIDTIKNVVDVFEDKLTDFGIDKETVDNVITKIEEFNEETKYVITFDIKNDSNHILSTKLSLPVNEEFFNSVEIGDVISQEKLAMFEEFANISQRFDGWTISVKDKIIRE